MSRRITRTIGGLLALFALRAVLATRSAHGATCTTNVSGTVNGATWTAAGSPYCLTADTTVTALTIDPGVEVEATGNFALHVTGALSAVGTAVAPIAFQTTAENAVGWQGIHFQNATAPGLIDHASITGSVHSGLRIINSSVQVANTSITNNTGASGGGVDLENNLGTPSVTFSEVTIADNVATDRGGGLYVYDPTGTFACSGCVVTGNHASGVVYPVSYGGGIYLAQDGHAAFTAGVQGCQISANSVVQSCTTPSCTANAQGGGMYADVGTTSVDGCRIEGNSVIASATLSAQARGGGLETRGTFTLTNSIVAGNATSAAAPTTALTMSAGIDAGPKTSLVNSIVVDNAGEGIRVPTPKSPTGAPALIDDFAAVNSIVYGNTGASIAGNDPSSSVTYSDIEGGYPGIGNIDLDPKFVTAAHDYHLTVGSPCVNRGSNAAAGLPANDLDGNARIFEGIVDMGAYELGTPIDLFDDGFETGDESKWSIVVGLQ